MEQNSDSMNLRICHERRTNKVLFQGGFSLIDAEEKILLYGREPILSHDVQAAVNPGESVLTCTRG